MTAIYALLYLPHWMRDDIGAMKGWLTLKVFYYNGVRMFR